MNTRLNQHFDDDSRFDKLVDGALPAAEYKVLLASLEDEPEGWRRCALAFLEAQAWGKECAAIRRIEEDESAHAQNPVERPEKKWSYVSAGPLIAAAAGIVLVFGLGMAMQGRFFPPERPGAEFAGQGPTGAVSAPPLMATEMDSVDPEIAAMRLVIDGAGNQEVVVPVIGDGKPGGETLVEIDPVIPDSVLRALRSRGHNIQRQQQFIPVPTGDGRHVIFPVEQYQITPVSSRSY